MRLFAFGLGVGTQNAKGDWLEVFYGAPMLGDGHGVVEEIARIVGYDPAKGANQAIQLHAEQRMRLKTLGDPQLSRLGNSARPVVATILGSDTAPSSVPEAYLKLHLLSHRLVKPHGVDLDGLFKILPNVVWTNKGAIDPRELGDAQIAARLKGETLEILSVDKFPRMTDYVVPSGVRIADAQRVRLGAYLGAGTTVMHEGFVNYNAGTEGPNMVEGRIAAGVFVEAGSDLGGGSSTMGTLSGGGTVRITVGKNCLIGANAGLGIPLGDDCTIEAGLYLTAASKVRVLTRDRKLQATVKAKDLARKPNLLFWRNSETGAIECLPNKGAVELNLELHSNN